MTDSPEPVTPITCQGIFAWFGSEWKRLKKIGYKKFTRDMRIFFALNIPNVSHLTDKEIADSIILDIILDQGLESERLITDIDRVLGGYRSPATVEEVTNNPGRCVWIGWVEVPRYNDFTDPTVTHNATIKAAFRDIDNVGQRIFDAAHGAVVQRYDYEIVDDSQGPEYQPPQHGPVNNG